MNVLITNDDGIDAPGIRALEQALDGTVYVVAPDQERSECGHSVDTKTKIQVEQRGARRWAVFGRPADCVRLALSQLVSDVRFDWVCSGVNQGGNLGVDQFISGTVAAAREAAIHGLPSVAFSHYLRRGVALDWDRVSVWTQRVFEQLRREGPVPSGIWNVNFPSIAPEVSVFPETVFCSTSIRPLPLAFEGDAETGFRYSGAYSDRDREPESDVAVCFGGAISITRQRLG